MARATLIQETLTRSVIGAFYDVYNALGFGYLEHLYVRALDRELAARGHQIAREVPARVNYKGDDLGEQRLDMVVDDLLVVEVKSSRLLPDVAHRQLLGYLRNTEYEVGLLLHFGPHPQFFRAVFENRLKTPGNNP